MTIYLVFSVLTSRPTPLIASNKVYWRIDYIAPCIHDLGTRRR